VALKENLKKERISIKEEVKIDINVSVLRTRVLVCAHLLPLPPFVVKTKMVHF
jgi:hypothetical protein